MEQSILCVSCEADGQSVSQIIRLRGLLQPLSFFSFHSPSLFYLLTVGVEVVYFRWITLRRTPQSIGFLWTRDRPVAETCT
jgi:hypothetical protein